MARQFSGVGPGPWDGGTKLQASGGNHALCIFGRANNALH